MALIKHLVDLDLNKNQLLNVVVQNLAVAPTSPAEGQIYWSTADDTLYVYNLATTTWIDLGENGVTNLSYTASASNGVVTSDSGSNATIPLATTGDAGLLQPSDKTKLNNTTNTNSGDNAVNTLYSGLQTNVSTNLTEGTTTTTTVDVNSSDGTNATLISASTSRAGVLSSAKFDEIVANTAKVSDINHNVSTNLTTTTTATTNTVVSSDGTNAVLPAATTTVAGVMTGADKTKLDGIEALADVTDATNVNAAGAVMNSDTSTSPMNFVIDEDNMISNSATKVPTQQSIKAYVDAQVTSVTSYQGGYDASTDNPSLDSSPIAGIESGDVWDVTVAGTFFTIEVEVGDSIRATVDSPTVEANWTVVQANLTPASIKTQYESNSNTNAYTDAEKTQAALQTGTNTGDEVSASTTVKGIIEIATQTEVNTGSDTLRAITPSRLKSTLGITGTLSTTLTYSALIGDAVATSIVVTHAIGNQFVQAEVYEVAAMDKVECEIELTSTTTTTFKFNVAPASNALRVVIIG